MNWARVLVLVALVGCSGNRGAPDADAGRPDAADEAEVPALCEKFAAAGCPIGAPLGYGEDCPSYFEILSLRSARTGCGAEHAAYLDCLEELPQACNAASCESLKDAMGACWLANPGGDTCTVACEASMADGCTFTVDSCLRWCTRQEAERVLAGCTAEGEALDDCQAAAGDVCSTETCNAERDALTACDGG